jgi:hypothetical protein
VGRSGRALGTSVCAALWAVVGARVSAGQGTAPSKAPGAGASANPAGRVTIEKPKARETTGGVCQILSDKTFSGLWGPSGLPTLAFTIGPKATMADEMHASKAPFTGPGRYPNEIMAVYLGKTALVDSYMGLGTVTVNPDGKTGTFALNDGTASGRWDCGGPPIQ